MRPTILNPLFTELNKLKGIGAKTIGFYQNLLKTENYPQIKDIIYHFPFRVIDRRSEPELFFAKDGDIGTVTVTAEEYISKNSRAPIKIICKNDTGYLTVIYFNMKLDVVKNLLPLGQKRIVSGKFEKFDGILQMIHPDYITTLDKASEVRIIEPVYPLSYGLSNKFFSKTVRQSLEITPDLSEWIEPNLLQKNNWNSWKKSLTNIHNPQSKDFEITTDINRKRLAYDEFLADQLTVAISRKFVKKKKGIARNFSGEYVNKLLACLPFKLTNGQSQVISEINSDLKSENRMFRLLQGDVGSGKTIVALIAMLNVVECGLQAAIMAPTEILAKQHLMGMKKLIEAAGLQDQVKISFLSGSVKKSDKTIVKQGLKEGESNILIGTHAVFQDDVEMEKLGLVVIDEQHKFGVRQRIALAKKGEKTDMLLLSATPIPRTLMLTIYGDMDISILSEKPANRQKIDTRIIPKSRDVEVIEGLKRAIASGQRVYWVCPHIEKPEDEEQIIKHANTSNVKERFENLKKVFGDKIGLVHGELKPQEKDNIMQKFKEGGLSILVATTVIEVGVDVPEATIIIIEDAEQFGLAQLHQLRGRVGRGAEKSSCILLYGNKLSEAGKRRLEVMRESDDGFIIAEEDLKLRGGGEVLGTKQSGLPQFRTAILPEDNDLLFTARDDVKYILEMDPKLTSTRGLALRELLYLFEYDKQIGNLLS
jgi:ATP-dependent DNA helicase RecG